MYKCGIAPAGTQVIKLFIITQVYLSNKTNETNARVNALNFWLCPRKNTQLAVFFPDI